MCQTSTPVSRSTVTGWAMRSSGARRVAAGLRLPDTDAEIVLQTEDRAQEIDFQVQSADAAALRIEAAGGVVVVPPFDIQIGRCVVVHDPWGNRLVLLDASKGLLVTDEAGNVIGNAAL